MRFVPLTAIALILPLAIWGRIKAVEKYSCT